MSRFPLIRLHLSGIFMKIISVRQRLYPALLLPLTFSPVLQAASAPNEQTMIVTATPQTVSELDTIRGFGSRSAFGVRGIRLYVDGIPATMPDGQGQISNIDINSIQDVEVLRGPFSALYGNASGGVINVTTETGRQPPSITRYRLPVSPPTATAITAAREKIWLMPNWACALTMSVNSR